jgi:hypothetical protein
VLVGVVDPETKDDFIDEQGLGNIEILIAKILARLKYKLVDTDSEIFGIQNRAIEPAIGIGAAALQFQGFGVQAVKNDVDTGSRKAARRIENMCSQPPHFYPPQL